MLLNFSRYRSENVKASCHISIFLQLSVDARSDLTICFIQMINHPLLIHTLFIRIINFNMPFSLYFILITALDWGAPGFLAISEKDIGFLSLFGLFSVFFTTCAGCSWQRQLFNDYNYKNKSWCLNYLSLHLLLLLFTKEKSYNDDNMLITKETNYIVMITRKENRKNIGQLHH